MSTTPPTDYENTINNPIYNDIKNTTVHDVISPGPYIPNNDQGQQPAANTGNASNNPIYNDIKNTTVHDVIAPTPDIVNTNKPPYAPTNNPYGTTVNEGDYISADINVVDEIIEILNTVKKNYISSGKDIIDAQVKKINAVPGYTTGVGTLANASVNMPLVRLEIKINSLIRKLENAKEQANRYDKSLDSESDDGDGDDDYSPWYDNESNNTKSTSTTTEPQTTPGTVLPPPASRTREVITEPITERPTEIITQPITETSTVPSTVGPLPVPKTNPQPATQSTGGNTNGGGNYYFNNSNTTTTTTPPTEIKTEVKLEEDIIKKGNSYTLPTSSKSTQPTTTPKSTQGNSAIPVLAGLAAAAAAGIGAKAYMDRKKNKDDEEDEIKAEDWSNNTDINIEYQEPTSQKEETLDFDDNGYETEKYGAKTNDDLEDLQ